MHEIFGVFKSAAEINETAVNLRREGDTAGIKTLARENGIDAEIADVFISGGILYICDDISAAIGKINLEAEELKPREIMEDWIEYLKTKCFEDEEMARAVMRAEKTIKGAVAEVLKWSFKNQIPVDKEILKAAGVNAQKVTIGIPGAGKVKQILCAYYKGGGK